MSTDARDALELECAPPEVKRYQRQKIAFGLASGVVGFVALAAAALFAGPWIDTWVRGYVGDDPWLRLTALACVYAVALEVLTLPFDFFSSFVLEHRYQLSNQTLWGWTWKRSKGYLLAGPLGLGLVLGLYALLWFSGAWWWLWAGIGFLAGWCRSTSCPCSTRSPGWTIRSCNDGWSGWRRGPG
jgi:STE24 endopeptidase